MKISGTSKYLIRDMTSKDWESVSRIYQDGMDTNIATFQATSPTWKEFDVAHTQNCRYVILCQDSVIGWAALTPVSKRPVYAGVAEVSIYIDDAFKGMGLGYTLLTYLIEQSEKEGYWTLQSGILCENLISVRLHEKCGFRLVGYREKIGKDRFGVWHDLFLMEKRRGEC